MSQANSYNERLFKRGFRKWLHEARFRWLRGVFERYDPEVDCVAELGCFDGRALEYISPPPQLYFGFDADWEGGLTNAQSLYSSNEARIFTKCVSPDEFDVGSNHITCAIALETLEHIPLNLLEGYLEKIFAKMRPGAYFIVSVPNEKGLLFLFKYFFKNLMLEGSERYSAAEVFWATVGCLDKVHRSEHKGFDWERLQGQLLNRFVLVECGGIQFPRLSPSLNPSIGIVLRKAK
jgi:hypothetical protein